MEISKKKEQYLTLRPLQNLEMVKPIYILPEDQLADEVLIPGFQYSKQVDCMMGYFTSGVLASLAPGLATYINNSESVFRLIISPLLRVEDHAAIEEGTKSVEDITRKKFDELIVTKDLIQQHTLKCLTYLIQRNRIEIKVALIKRGLFHPKVWLFKNTGDLVAVHGSGNATYAGIRQNIEQIAISRSWQDSNQDFVAEKLDTEFKKLWEKENQNCVVIPIPEAVKEQLLKKYNTVSPPFESDLSRYYTRAKAFIEETEADRQNSSIHEFKIPNWLKYDEGQFRHQGKAVNAWCNARYQGVLEMATGSGKTITSMIGAYRLYEDVKPLLIVVTAPYTPLIGQWCEELSIFGLNPINLKTKGNAAKRAKVLQRLKRRLRSEISSVETIVVSHDTLCTKEFQDIIREFGCSRLLIADEVHNLGRHSFIENPPDYFDYRLGLSATPIRQYDEEGTNALFDFFGQVVFKYTLEEAVGQCLVEYEYHIHKVFLTDTEMEAWINLTEKIKKNSWRDEDALQDEYLAKLRRDRRALLETASGKVTELERILDKEDVSNIQHTLIYTSDKGPDQIKHVNHLLNLKNILFHQLTAEETANQDQTKRIIKSFQDGDIQVLTAKRVLDEGVNIPQIRTAFILASTTVERQWVQRRGRLLRTCKDINKTHSKIHDFVALPQRIDEGLDSDARGLVRSELQRVQEFAKLAKNAGRTDGPLVIIDQMVKAAYM